MALLDEVGEELQEERDDEQTDMHAIDIGIGSDNNLVITKSIESVLNIEGSLQEIEFLVFVNHFLGESERVERLSAEGEHSLRVHIAAFRDTSAGGIALGDEDAGLLLA